MSPVVGHRMDTDRAAEYLMRAQEARTAASQARQDDLREGFIKVAEEWERMAGQLLQDAPASSLDQVSA